MVSYTEILNCRGVLVPFDPSIITPPIEKPLRAGRYEVGEDQGLQEVLRPGDRVLELGAGLGLLSTVAARFDSIGSVTTVEANPELIPLIRETHRLNGVNTVDLRHGVVTADAGPPVPFYLRAHFWASSMSAKQGSSRKVVEVERVPIDQLIREVQPTVIVCDIEGGEVGLLDRADLGSVRAVVMEFHEKVYGAKPRQQITEMLAAAGLLLVPAARKSSISYFMRPAVAVAQPDASLLPPRAARPWPARDPKVFVATCMKDEGPFILEWLAWHRTIGITDFVVFTNDCSDGTDLILDRLQDMGQLLHLPNPAVAAGNTAYQPAALNYAHGLKAMREADFFISMDVDEFINIRVGAGHVNDLLEKAGPFDVLSISEVNHGANNRQHYEQGWILDLFPAHQSTTPGIRKSRRGVKSLVRLSDKVERLRNHRPDMLQDRGPVRWLDGSGRDQLTLPADRSENGLDCRGTYSLVRLEHFALRSLDSYLAKMYRGDVVIADKKVSRTYWRTRNKNEEDSSDYGDRLMQAKGYFDQHFAADKQLMALHEAACRAHAARIAELVNLPEFKERREWVLAEHWP
ncbi:MAG: FkbM family methyltransferase [Paracoccaceae bacterium]